MSLLINGMEMPKDGFITITVTSDGRVIGNSKKENGKFEYLGNEDIAKAVSVPEPHGDLIDKNELTMCSYDLVNYFWFRAVPEETLNEARVIIPASEEGE